MLLELARDAGLDPKRKSATYGGEYCSPCPKCGGNDRFLIWPNKQKKNVEGAYWCRGCNINGDSIQFCKDILGLEYNEAFKRCGVESKPSHFPKNRYNIPEKSPLASPEWQAKMKELSGMSHRLILKRVDILERLEKRGLPKEAVTSYELGYLSAKVIYDRKDLGLRPTQEGKETIWIPKGITIPTLESGKILRLKVRRDEWHPNDKIPKYIEVSGGLKGLNLIGSRTKPHIIVVESELDAFAVHWALKGQVLVIAVGSNTKHPDSKTHALVKACERLVIVCDNDDPGKAMGGKWERLYPKARVISVPVGKDIGEAFEQGFDVAGFLWECLKPIS
uniref:Toprim-like n=1 Tax=Candidatus Kentrum sp. SD TaxID=2126332 RepID=A0A451BQB0_9GAMM|nr:MAG: Toprim-like [Candidatus Kentron sp. SD]VFK80417.1 MAG: Toprim-like [Candidatus Kentron sp. SD]